MSDTQATKIFDSSANPAPVGLLGFGMTTVLLNIANANLIPLGSMVLAMGLFYGGLAQIFAGWMEWKKGNTFGLTAFMSFGLFWESFAFLIIMPKLGWADAASPGGVTAYLSMWGLFTFVMWIATFKHNRALQVVFFTLWILFGLLAIGEITGNATIKIIAGWEGMFCGLSAIYAGLGQVLNETYGKSVVPLG